MATSIANISPPGSGLKAPDGETLEAGASLLVSGSHGTSLVAEKVLHSLGDRQSNLNSHLRSHARNQAEKPKPTGTLAADARATFMDHMGMIFPSVTKSWNVLLGSGGWK